MLDHTVRNHVLLAATAGVTLVLGLGVTAQGMPREGGDVVRGAASSDLGQAPVAVAAALLDTTPGAEVTGATAPAPAAVAVPPSVGSVAIAVKLPAAVKKASPAPVSKAPAAPAAGSPVSALPTAPVAGAPAALAAVATPIAVARRTPTSAEVEDTIDELQRQIGGLLRFVPPKASQIAEAGDEACTGFDNGETFAQVKAKGMSAMPSTITVKPATVDWAVRRAVTLYCPGHADKLV